MTGEYIALGIGDLAIASLLVFLSAALSIALRLGVERRLLIVAARMTVQLTLIALVLESLFSIASPWLTALAALVMAVMAGWEILSRQERPLAGAWTYGIGTGSLLVAATVVTVLALTTQVRPDPWYAPRYALPLLGMILANTMSGISLGLNALLTAAARERPAIEAQLCLGADRWQALRPTVRHAVRTGLTPIMNAMAATGLINIPGMMTGQILAGVEPVEAMKYQLLIMFLVAGSAGLGVVAVVHAGARRLTDTRHRLRLDRLAARAEDG